MAQPIVDLVLGQVLVGGRKRIDGRHDETLRRGDLLSVFRQRDHDRIVALDEARQIFPQLGIRLGQVDMATPDPRRFLAEMIDQRQRLRIVHDDHVVVEMHARRVLEHDLFVDILLQVAEIDFTSLQGIVHPLCNAEEVRSPLNDAPARPDAGAVHQQCQRRENFGNPAAIVSGVHVDDMEIAELFGLAPDPVRRLATYQRLVVIDRRESGMVRIVGSEIHACISLLCKLDRHRADQGAHGGPASKPPTSPGVVAHGAGTP